MDSKTGPNVMKHETFVVKFIKKYILTVNGKMANFFIYFMIIQ